MMQVCGLTNSVLSVIPYEETAELMQYKLNIGGAEAQGMMEKILLY